MVINSSELKNVKLKEILEEEHKKFIENELSNVVQEVYKREIAKFIDEQINSGCYETIFRIFPELKDSYISSINLNNMSEAHRLLNKLQKVIRKFIASINEIKNDIVGIDTSVGTSENFKKYTRGLCLSSFKTKIKKDAEDFAKEIDLELDEIDEDTKQIIYEISKTTLARTLYFDKMEQNSNSSDTRKTFLLQLRKQYNVICLAYYYLNLCNKLRNSLGLEEDNTNDMAGTKQPVLDLIDEMLTTEKLRCFFYEDMQHILEVLKNSVMDFEELIKSTSENIDFVPSH